jgi:hypothetical protein
MLAQSMYMEHNMKITEKTFNIQTGEETITERDETAAEKKIREASEKEATARKAEAEANAIAKQVILDRIGLTADELKTILG